MEDSCAAQALVPDRFLELLDVAVSLRSLELPHLIHDGGLLVVIGADGLAAVLDLHRVDELGGLGVAPIAEAGDVEGSHHIMVLMNKVVAVEHVDTIVRGVACNDCDLLVLAKKDNVLQSLLLVVEAVGLGGGGDPGSRT